MCGRFLGLVTAFFVMLNVFGISVAQVVACSSDAYYWRTSLDKRYKAGQLSSSARVFTSCFITFNDCIMYHTSCSAVTLPPLKRLLLQRCSVATTLVMSHVVIMQDMGAHLWRHSASINLCSDTASHTSYQHSWAGRHNLHCLVACHCIRRQR